MKEVDGRLLEWWNGKRGEIERRLDEFKEIRTSGEKRIFEEMCFCLLTPQSSAVAADRAIRHMTRTALLYKGKIDQLAVIISRSGIRYGDNKARYVVEARRKFLEKRDPLLEDLLVEDSKISRDKVVKNVKGLGYKEASHFLRNIGYEGLAILDRHILRTMCEAGVVDRLPKTIGRKNYLHLEEKFLEYAERLGIPPDALDLVMWSAKTGRVFK